MNDPERVKWVDVFRFFGMWAIYLGHFGQQADKLYPFVFTYHVPLFFFAAGFFFPRLDQSFLGFLKSKTLQLVVPYIFFSFVALTIFTLVRNWTWPDVKIAAITFIFGIRNQVSAGSLWFIPCLYVMLLFNFVIYKIFKNKYACMCFAIVMLVISQYGLTSNPLITPSWVFNIDSALYYYFWYVLGALLFPILLRTKSLKSYGVVEWILTALAVVVTLVCFFKGSGRLYDELHALLPDIGRYKIIQLVLTSMVILAIIYTNVFLAKLFSGVLLFGRLGRETLILCGTEDVLKLVLPQLLLMVGLSLNLPNSFAAVVFSLLCLVISQRTVIPFLNLYLPALVGKVRRDLPVPGNPYR